jgi:hypothetical protein
MIIPTVLGGENQKQPLSAVSFDAYAPDWKQVAEALERTLPEPLPRYRRELLLPRPQRRPAVHLDDVIVRPEGVRRVAKGLATRPEKAPGHDTRGAAVV